MNTRKTTRTKAEVKSGKHKLLNLLRIGREIEPNTFSLQNRVKKASYPFGSHNWYPILNIWYNEGEEG